LRVLFENKLRYPLKLNNKGNSLVLMLIGVALIVVGIVVAILTVTNYLSHFLPSEIVTASSTYIAGTLVSAFLIAFGLFLCWIASKD
jgi:ABC-type nickel/cobalt efflux system permease component RcnA